MIRPRTIRGVLMVALLATAPLFARPVRITLWISGGGPGLLSAGRESPGMLGVMMHRRESGDPGFWLDVGGSGDFPLLEGLGLPDAAVPGGEVMRGGGWPLLRDFPEPWTALNLGILPQYPGESVPVPRSRVLAHADGGRIRVMGLLGGDSPFRVPPARLRPLAVLDPETALREVLPEYRASPGELLVLVLSEHSDPVAWSRAFPDIPLMVEPAGPVARVVPLEEGRRLRVRPAQHGRAVVRVTLVWDTVTRTFAPPTAEVEWVGTPDLSGIALPEGVSARLRPLHPAPDPTPWLRDPAFVDRLAGELLRRGNADAVLLPTWRRKEIEAPARPESWRAAWVPEDHLWVRVSVDAPTARSWMSEPVAGAVWRGRVEGAGERPVLLPAEFAAGGGGQTRGFRRVLDHPDTLSELLPFTTRDLLPFAQDASP